MAYSLTMVVAGSGALQDRVRNSDVLQSSVLEFGAWVAVMVARSASSRRSPVACLRCTRLPSFRPT